MTIQLILCCVSIQAHQIIFNHNIELYDDHKVWEERWNYGEKEEAVEGEKSTGNFRNWTVNL